MWHNLELGMYGSDWDPQQAAGGSGGSRMAWAHTELFFFDSKELIPPPIGEASVGTWTVHARQSCAINVRRGVLHVTGLR